MTSRHEVACPPKIILAEDDNGVRRSLQLLLLGQNLEVRSYAASADVLADTSNRDARCLIADYRMPEMDGIALLIALHGIGWTGHAILITAYRCAELDEKARSAGFDAVLDKPISNQRLFDTIAQMTG